MAITPEEKQRLQKGSRRGIGVVVVVVAVVLILIAAVVLSGVLNPPTTQKITILGAGATFPCPLITKWSSDYSNVSLSTVASQRRAKGNFITAGSAAGLTGSTRKTWALRGSERPWSQGDGAWWRGLF